MSLQTLTFRRSSSSAWASSTSLPKKLLENVASRRCGLKDGASTMDFSQTMI